MKKIDNDLCTISNESFYKKIAGSKGVFIDIETTGLSRENCCIYLVGILYPVNTGNTMHFTLSLLFAEAPGEEERLLMELSGLLGNSYYSLISFNGRHFDLPFLLKRYERYALTPPDCLTAGTDTDIYAEVRPFRRSFGMSSLNQKSVERMLGICREDKYSGKELISVYLEYVKTGDPGLEKLLLTHNRDDVLGMTEILPVLTYTRIFNSGEEDAAPKIKSAVRESHLGFDRNESAEFVISFFLPDAVPKPHLFHNLRLFLEASGDTGILRIPLYEGELKHFFPNYRDYLYIPSEDRVILRELGSLMKETEYEKASPLNCCIKTRGLFLPLPGNFSFPDEVSYKQEPKSKTEYVLLSDEIMNSPLLPEYLKTALKTWFR